MNIVKVTAPFDIDSIKTYFENKDNTIFLIDYDNSTLKGLPLITYLSNIGINSDIENISDQQEASQLLYDYISTNLLVEIPSLVTTAITCLLAFKGLSTEGMHTLLDEQHVSSFNEQHADYMKKLETILTSCSLYNLYTINVDEYKDWVESHEHIDDDQYVGVNFVHFFFYYDFFRFYERVDRSLYRFFDKQFNEYMFKGQPLFAYWHNLENPISLLTINIASGDLDSKSFLEALG